MARPTGDVSLLPLALCFALLLPASLAQLENDGSRQEPYQIPGHQSRRAGRRGGGQCRIEELNALEPSVQLKSEAGLTEFWDENDEQFQCAGVVASRHTIEPKGLLLPSYSNSPRLVYVIQGTGSGGLVIPGCPETFQSFSRSSQSRRREDGSRQQGDEHQKIERLRQGDIVALPAGVAFWFYNDGNNPFVVVSIADTSNHANQLDNNSRMFFLAGSQLREQGSRRRGAEEYQTGHNIFRGFDTRIISQSFGVSEETARKLQGEGEEQQRRGHIVRVEGELQFASQEEYHEEERGMTRRRSTRRGEQLEEERRGRRGNGVEETLCNFKIRVNIGQPEHADVYSSQGGQWASLTSSKLPILQYLQLGAERGRLNRNAILAPHWNINAHSIVYVIRGNACVQIVDSSGRAVFDDRLREGQLIVVPQNFVVVKQAIDDEFEWVSFKTSDYALTSPLAGKTSVIRGIPEDVLVNSYRISPEEARRLKYERKEETLVLTPWSEGSRASR